SYGQDFKSASRGALTEHTTYDGYGRPTVVTLGGIQRTYGHDSLGRMTFESAPGASTGTSYRYDALDRIDRVTRADGQQVTMTYGAGSKTVTDERGRSTRYTYRAYGDPDMQFLMTVSAPETSASISIVRNGKDLVTSATQAGFTRSFGYNTAGYLTSVVQP